MLLFFSFVSKGAPDCISHRLGVHGWELGALRVRFLPQSRASWTWGCERHSFPWRKAGRSAAQARGPGLEDGPQVRCGMEMRDADCARKPLHPQPVCKTVLAATAAEPSRLGAARSPAHLPRLPAAGSASLAESPHSINNHKPPAHPPLKINNSVIRVISEAS